jgi:hypothetical protein
MSDLRQKFVTPRIYFFDFNLGIKMNSRLTLRHALLAGIAAIAPVQLFAQEATEAEAIPSVAQADAASNEGIDITKPLNNLIANQWIQLRASGEVVGNVVQLSGDSYVPVQDVRVLLMQNGRVVSESVTGAQGQVTLASVTPGQYTLIARGENTVGSFSVVVLDMENGSHLPIDFSMPLVSMSTNKFGGLLASQSGSRPSVPSAIAADPLGRGREYQVRDFRVSLDVDGMLHGNLSLPGLSPLESRLGNTNVMLFDEQGNEVVRTQSDANGHYKFAGIKPGCYGIVATGRGYFTAHSVCVVDESAEVAGSTSGKKLTAYNAATGAINTEMNQQSDNDSAEFALEPVDGGGTPVLESQGAPMFAGGPGGGFPGGAAGGGGAGGGILGGRFGTIALLGGLGGLAAAVASSDDDSSTVPATAVANGAQ